MANLLEKAIEVAGELDRAESRRELVYKEIKELEKRRDELQDSSEKEAKRLIDDAGQQSRKLLHEIQARLDRITEKEKDLVSRENALKEFPIEEQRLRKLSEVVSKQREDLESYRSSLSAKEDALRVREEQVSKRENAIASKPAPKASEEEDEKPKGKKK